ncbi:DoxX family protein [Streptomyces sp. RKND-216]|uniref:DoxX family protein n=1 Tax=Streptomyces sp. RKND-216 TaxID=2562581 RepID=UPI00109DC08C|nr:DoxX family protein [Streptomyces sp. RKND-216]THA25770.1 DoxX family protein [Streptomyces sp. RKND-216]
MSVDTRTPRTPTGGTRGFTDDEPVLSTVKVPSDPGQVIVNHVSFRVLLAGPAPRSAALEAPRLRAARAAGAKVGFGATAGASVGAAPRAGRRRAPLVWSGHANPEDTGAIRLLQAVRVPPTGLLPSPSAAPEAANASTRTLPRLDDAPPTVVGPRGPGPSEHTQPLLAGVRPARGAYDDLPGGPDGTGHLDGPADDGEAYADGVRRPRRNDPVRHAYYPGRRMNLGMVLLPLRIFLGFISVYAGMGKLSDPVYFNGGARGSMVTWLRSLEPWAIATPLHDFAVSHPVGAGLTVAFLQVVVGVLTIFGLWQRLAAGIGAALSLALLVTVSWSSVPVYDTPDIIYLAAWSPLLIAGAPVYSLDGRLAGEAWRTLGPRADIWDLRRRVLRRGAVVAVLVCGLALLVGAVLGGAVRASDAPRVSEPGQPPVNHLPGSPLPQEPKKKTGPDGSTGVRTPGTDRTPGPSASSAGTPSGRSGAPSAPSQQETVQAPAQPAAPQAPEQPAAPSTTGTGSSGPSGDDSSAGGGTATGGSTGGGTTGGGGPERGGALGGLLG